MNVYDLYDELVNCGDAVLADAAAKLRQKHQEIRGDSEPELSPRQLVSIRNLVGLEVLLAMQVPESGADRSYATLSDWMLGGPKYLPIKSKAVPPPSPEVLGRIGR